MTMLFSFLVEYHLMITLEQNPYIMKKTLLFFLVGFIYNISLFSQDIQLDNTLLIERQVATGLQIPWEILWGPDDHIWVTERYGKVKRIDPENGNTNTVLDLSGTIWGGSGEPGLLGMALHPDFENTPKVYLVYTYQSNGRKERLVAYDWDGTSLSNEQIILDDILADGIHNGSRIIFLPDNTILMTTGDVGLPSLARNPTTMNGKTLRLNMDGSIPADNPIPNSYVYTYGNRNAQGLCYGSNGIIYSSEHGSNHSDEINIIMPNRNYGWPSVEGPCDSAWEQDSCTVLNVAEPIWSWTDYCIAPNGIEYYDHDDIPEWKGSLLCAILGGIGTQEPRLAHLELNGDGTQVLAENQYITNKGRIRDICINPHNGAVYVATNGPSYPGSSPNIIYEYISDVHVTSTSTQEPLNVNQFIKVSPNPIRRKGRVEFSKSFVGHHFEIISYTGQVVKSGKINDTVLEIRKRDFSKGYYYIKATNEKGTITQTIVVQ